MNDSISLLACKAINLLWAYEHCCDVAIKMNFSIKCGSSSVYWELCIEMESQTLAFHFYGELPLKNHLAEFPISIRR